MSQPPDFYVGYRPRTSKTIAAWMRPRILALLALAALLPLVLVSEQQEFAEAVFEYGHETALLGMLRTAPYPVLEVVEEGGARPYLLVGSGKHGAREQVGGLDGRLVEARGERITRDDQWMLQLSADRPAPVPGAVMPRGAERSLGRHTLAGEIVDGKCYLGVMQPGRGKPHRACAARCISGGVPPVFLVTDRRGERRHYLLLGADGRPLSSEILDRVAEPLAVTGEVVSSGGLWYLKAEPADFRRLGATTGGTR